MLSFVVIPILSFSRFGFLSILPEGFILTFSKTSGWGEKRKFFCFDFKVIIFVFSKLKTESPERTKMGGCVWFFKKIKTKKLN